MSSLGGTLEHSEAVNTAQIDSDDTLFAFPPKRCRRIIDEEIKEEEQISNEIPVLGNGYDGWLSPLYDLKDYLKKRELTSKDIEKQLFNTFINKNPHLLGNAKDLRLPGTRLK